MNADWRDRYNVALDGARQAGAIALRYFDTSVPIDWKADATPVTIADREAEECLRSMLLGRFPQDGFLGEEQGESAGASGFRWIVDPVDATRN